MAYERSKIKDGIGSSPTDVVHVHRLNLNLLYPLDAILHAPTLPEAGRRVGLTQSAMSHALRCLREHFGDDLVIDLGGEQQLTSLGMALRVEVGRVLRNVDGTINFALSFDPLTTTGTITVATSEVVEQILLGPIVQRLLTVAPGLTVTVLPLHADGPHRALDRGVDLLLVPASAAVPELEALPILTDHVACMIWTGHTDFADRYVITESDYRAASHAIARDERIPTAGANRKVVDLLRARRIAMRTSSQAALPMIIIGSDLVATGSSWLFQSFASRMPVRVVAAPFPEQHSAIVAQWPPHRRRDPMLAWFVKQIEAYVATFPLRMQGKTGHP